MQNIFDIHTENKKPKYLQIVDSVINSIKLQQLKKGDKILSINELSNEFFLSRDTVQKAYELLAEKNVIVSVRGKGFYINRTDVSKHYRVLLLFNKISNYKKQIYNAFVHEMADKATVDLKIYHCDTDIFLNLLHANMNEYDYYVIMPHFYEREAEAYNAIDKIPKDKLLILDKELAYAKPGYAAVFQDFKNDIFDALESALNLLKKYNKLILVYPIITPYPYEIVTGFKNFCMQYNFCAAVINEINDDINPQPKEVYIVIEETDLVNLIKKCKTGNLEIGKNIGIISCNETPLKEILLDGITVISTDHVKMGELAAKLILENKKEKIKNQYSLIVRKSL